MLNGYCGHSSNNSKIEEAKVIKRISSMCASSPLGALDTSLVSEIIHNRKHYIRMGHAIADTAHEDTCISMSGLLLLSLYFSVFRRDSAERQRGKSLLGDLLQRVFPADLEVDVNEFIEQFQHECPDGGAGSCHHWPYHDMDDVEEASNRDIILPFLVAVAQCCQECKAIQVPATRIIVVRFVGRLVGHKGRNSVFF